LSLRVPIPLLLEKADALPTTPREVKVAKALGLPVPRVALLRADEVPTTPYSRASW